jgi:hypothetical protein
MKGSIHESRAHELRKNFLVEIHVRTLFLTLRGKNFCGHDYYAKTPANTGQVRPVNFDALISLPRVISPSVNSTLMTSTNFLSSDVNSVGMD